jgi:SP family sugar:H+ symporter-like MFS transporter
MTDIFMSNGFEKSLAVKNTIYVDAVALVVTLVCTVIIERVGRRKLLLVGSVGLGVTLFFLSVFPLIAVCYNILNLTR